MGDQRDKCPICLEAFDDHVFSLCPRWAGPFPVRLLCWPCGHRVHLDCILQNQASVSSAEAPCFQCRTPAYTRVRGIFAGMHGADIMSRVPAATTPHGPAEDHPVPANAVRMPRVAALCCHRVVGPIDGRFLPIADDRRMTFMGLDDRTGAMQWTCLSCGKQLELLELPPLEQWPRSCSIHGGLCLVFDCATFFGLQRYWSCMDDRLSRNDVALPICHRTIGIDENNSRLQNQSVSLITEQSASQQISVASSSDEDTWSPMSLSEFFSPETLTAMRRDSDMEDTCIPQLVYLKARLQPHPCCIGHNAKILKRAGMIRSANCED